MRFLARGGMGEVYEAFDQELEAPVALKTMRPEIAENPASVDRLKQEIQLARRITHPSVCRLFDFYVHSRRGRTVVFVTMELLSGERLDERLSRTGAQDLDSALEIARGIGAALAAAHRAHVIHRDLKPGNVFLIARGDGVPPRIVVTDFGIAAAEEDAASSTSGRIVGTPGYMAPEQRRGEPIGPEADLYALGVLLHELLFGRRPNDIETAERGHDRVRDGAAALEARLAGLPARVAAVLRRCLVADPRERTIRAEQIVDALAPASPNRMSSLRAAPPAAADRGWFTSWAHSQSMPDDLEARVAYARGLEALQALHAEAAVPHFEACITREPGFGLAHSALAEAWSVLGFLGRAEASARTAFLTCGALPARDRIAIEARYRKFTFDWVRGIELQEALYTFDPEQRDLGIALTAMQLDSGRTADALETIAELRENLGEGIDDPRIDLLEAEQGWIAADTARQCEAAARAIEGATRAGRPIFEARGHFLLATGYFHQGRFDEAEAEFGVARRITGDDPRGTALILNSLGLLHRSRGQVKEANACYEEALRVARAHGQVRDVANAVSNLAAIQMTLGNVTEAMRFCEEAIRGHRELGNQRSLARTLVLQAIVQGTLGDLPAALLSYREALSIARHLGDAITSLTVFVNLANACATWGRFAEAHRHAEEAYRLARAAGEPTQSAHSKVLGAFSLIGWGRFEEAEQDLRAAMATLEQVGDVVRLSSTRLCLGQVLLLRGRIEEAQAEYETSREEALRIGRPQFTGWALAGLAEVAYWAGRLDEARHDGEAALRLRQETRDEWSLLMSFQLLAQVELAAGRTDEARAHATVALERAVQFGRGDDEALALLVDCQCVLAEWNGNHAPRHAIELLERAREAASSSENLIVRFLLDLREAEVRIQSTDWERAEEALGRASLFMEQTGLLLYRSEVHRIRDLLAARSPRETL